MRCMLSTTRVYFDKCRNHAVCRRRVRIAGALMAQKMYRGWKGRIRAEGFRRIAGAKRLLRNERIVRWALARRRREAHARWAITRWWRRSLLRWRTPLYLAWQRRFSATELQRIVRGYLGRGRAFRRWRTFTRAAIFVQRVFRGFVGRLEAARQRTSIALQRAAIMLQRAYRAKMARDSRDEEMRLEIEATQTIQRVWRGHCGREVARERAWELHLQHLRSFSAKVQRTVGMAPRGQRNERAMRATRDIRLQVEKNKRKIRNRQAKARVLEKANIQAKLRCGEIVQELLDHRTRITSITEGIFHDSVKRAELVNLHEYLKLHLDCVEQGIKNVHQALRDEVRAKLLLSDENFDRIVKEHLGVDGDAKTLVELRIRTKKVKVGPSRWCKARAIARKRDTPLPRDQRPLDAEGRPIPPPPVVPFMWPRITAFATEKGALEVIDL